MNASQKDSFKMKSVHIGKEEPGKLHRYAETTTQALYISMRDGIKLAIDIILPKSLDPNEQLPTILFQTRYWRAIELRWPFNWLLKKWVPKNKKPLQIFSNKGYAIVLVDVRGTGASFGFRTAPFSEAEIRDGADIVDWIIAQSWSNGQVATWGISYPGTTAELLAVNNHPAVKALIPMFNEFDVYTDIVFPGGIFNHWFIETWAQGNNHLDRNDNSILGRFRLIAKGVKPVDDDRNKSSLKQAIQQHASNTDVFEASQRVTFRDDLFEESGITMDDISVFQFKEDIERLNVPINSWGSWMDAATADAIIRRFLTFKNPQRAVIGAWSHGAKVNASPFVPYANEVEPSIEGQCQEWLEFLDSALKEKEDVVSRKTLIYYTMGEEKWKQTDIWPPTGTSTQIWYLDEDNMLSQIKPDQVTGVDSYTIDFTATTGTKNRWYTQIGGPPVIYPDRAQEDKKLLTYTSPPLEEDIEITGHPIITLFLASTHEDGAIYTYLEEVDPTGRVTCFTEGQLRVIHHKISSQNPPYEILIPYHSFKRIDCLTLIPNEITKISFGLFPTSALIRKGHQIRVAISGADKDTFARLPAEGIPIITIARNTEHASFIDLPVVHTEPESMLGD